MKRIVALAAGLVVFALAALLQGQQSAAPSAPATQSPISWTSTQQVTVTDPKYQMPAYTLAVPTGWHFGAEMIRPQGCHGNGLALNYKMDSPDGLTAIIQLAGAKWKIVGIFDSGGSAFDSEIWGDAVLLNQAYNRPENIYQSVTARLPSPADFQAFKDRITSDPQMTVSVDREIDYYAKQSQVLTTLIVTLGLIVGLVMAIGAIFGALNTMYSAVSERSREIATMRALGFRASSVVLSFMFEALLIAGIGGVLGCLAVLPLNGFTASTLNFATFSSVAFSFRVSPLLIGVGMAFAVMMGLVGGTPPAIRAARRPITTALRGL